MTSSLNIVWFKRDLRIVDHRPLVEAARRGPVLPLFVVEPDYWAQPDTASRHYSFLVECLHDLRQNLAALGQPLVVRTGEMTEVLETLRQNFSIAGLWSHEETGNCWTFERDKAVAAWCKAHGVAWHEMPQHGVVRRLKSRDGWARHWDHFMGEPVTPPPDALPPIDGLAVGAIPEASDLKLAVDPCPGRQRGGREAAIRCLDSFLHQRGEDYRKDMSSPVTGFDGCSRLSPYLAMGSLAMREVAQTTWARQRDLKHNPPPGRSLWRGSMSSFSGRLHWHCHFIQKLEDEPSLEFKNLHPAYDGMRPAEPDRAHLAAWQKGETGLPFVDACMRALTATGWMNFRMRAMLMAVASYHLWLDWRKPGEHLARLFTDYEPGIHWPQVQMQSGTTGINTIRIYNPVKQGLDQDPGGVFVRQWVPELADVPDEHIQHPWTWDKAGTVLDKAYPLPVVDHLAAAKEARQKIWAARRGDEFRKTASDIQNKHGSRKSGIPMTGRRPRRKADDRQMGFDLRDNEAPS